MAILVALTNMAFPVVIILIMIAITAALTASNYSALDTICEYIFATSVILIAFILLFNLSVALIIYILTISVL